MYKPKTYMTMFSIFTPPPLPSKKILKSKNFLAKANKMYISFFPSFLLLVLLLLILS